MTSCRVLAIAFALVIATAVLLFTGFVYYAGMTTLFAGIAMGWVLGRVRR